MLLALAYSGVILLIAFKGQNLNIIELTKKHSPVLGNIIGLILALFFILVAAAYLYDLADFLQMLLPQTPTAVFSLLVISLGAYAIKLGLEVLARLAVLLILPVLILIAVGIVPNLFTINFPLILIPLENWPQTIKGVIFESAVFGELLVLTMLLPATKRSEKTARFIIIPIIFNGLLVAVLVWTLFGNFNVFTTKIIYKLFELYRNIGRIESMFIFLWVSTFFIKVSISLYAAVRGLSDFLGLKSYEPLVYPMAILIVFLSLATFPSYRDFFAFYVDFYPLAALSVELGIPLLFLIALVRTGLKKSSGTKG